MFRQPDFLDELDAERTAANPDSRASWPRPRERRALIAQVAARRHELQILQAEMTRQMTTSQAFVSRFESGDVDPH